MDFAARFEQGLTYHDFLARYGSDEQRRRWDEVHRAIGLTDPQKQLLRSFPRAMKVLVTAGTWCDDCVEQCPIFDHFAAESERLQIRFFDRDEHKDLAEALSICGASRVPSVLFLSEDGFVCGRYGDRTLAKYRQVVADQLGPACPTGLTPPDHTLQQAVVQEWLDQFERIQWMLRTSGRLRTLHGD